MQELVGQCKTCNKHIFCQDGFINGVVLEDKSLLCFDCYDKEQGRTFQATE
ncbi:hypothetical protein Back11_54920 [Paenibacillus baekrokdamisoli]|uniref:Uncharacterized protein n=1 Tax=Paenibacillus baekrokdamisoli TaxID=1712516 RepID=A0A3G9IYZ2_9BACL|nr:hypothetical protein Back11_54920 [Paenibacillus baekrokdamisoli]